MALAFDAATGANIAAAASTTFAHTVAGSDRVLYVIVCQWAAAAGNVATAVTYNGVSLTQVADTGFSAGNDRVTVWRLIAPATGANNVVATIAAGATPNASGRIYAVSLTGAHQTTPERDTSIATGSSTGPTVTVDSNAADIVLDGLASDASGGGPTYTMVADAGRTQIGNAESGDEEGAVSREESPGASEVMNWTISVSRTWALAGVSVQASAGGASGVPRFVASYRRRRAW